MLVPPLSDLQWSLVRPCLPRPARDGRPRADERLVLEAVLLVLANGWRWNDLPAGGVAPATAWRHLRAWQQAGIWPRMWRADVPRPRPAGPRPRGEAPPPRPLLPAPPPG